MILERYNDRTMADLFVQRYGNELRYVNRVGWFRLNLFTFCWEPVERSEILALSRQFVEDCHREVCEAGVYQKIPAVSARRNSRAVEDTVRRAAQSEPILSTGAMMPTSGSRQPRSEP